MIISVERLKQFITTDVSDMVLQARLEALETLIRNKTNNNFQDRRFRTIGDTFGNHVMLHDASLFKVGDTIMIDEDLCVIEAIEGEEITVDVDLFINEKCIVTKVVYPKDIILGVVDVMDWMLKNPSSKAGISSETLSRHSVTYKNDSEYDSDFGCPKHLLSFLNKYMKARF